jgi:CRISPR/Cas system CMR subunit Cmr4 (Cas7 group RAMP superfamily)
MILACRHLHLAHVTFEALAPLSIGGGKPDGVFDVELARDANGLPAIPGASLAGVLRHLYAAAASSEKGRELFGYAEGGAGRASRVHCGWAHIHNSKNQPIEDLLHPIDDPLLKPLVEENPAYRDHVRIGHRGAAANRGKFDRSYVPAGMRFTAEVKLWSEHAQDPDWSALLALLHKPLFRIGGATRRGYGKLGVQAILSGAFDLGTREGLDALVRLQAGDVSCLSEPEISPDTASDLVTATLRLEPEAGWRFGQGKFSMKPKSKNGKPSDALPVSERRVVWENDQGKLGKRDLLVPASSVKGALAHRIAFHYNRLAGCYADAARAREYDPALHNDAVRALFGHATDHDRGDGQAGVVFLDDVYLDTSQHAFGTQMHNSVDRFTGGVRDHVLFSEELAYGKGFCLALHIDSAALEKASRAVPQAREALRFALDDLAQGRLALGAGSAKGHGYCTGVITWSDGGKWIHGEPV